MLVNPVRDGLNLTAKEFVACQSENAGALLLSPHAGSWHEDPRASPSSRSAQSGAGSLVAKSSFVDVANRATKSQFENEEQTRARNSVTMVEIFQPHDQRSQSSSDSKPQQAAVCRLVLTRQALYLFDATTDFVSRST